MTTATMSRHFSLTYLADEIGKRVPAVKTVFADHYGDFVSVWTVVSDFDRNVRNEIYDAEAALIHEHPDMKFDFHVVAANENLHIPKMTVVYVRQSEILSARKAHIEQAKANEKLVAHLDRAPQFCDWRCTVIYYAALHYIQAYFSGLNPPVVFSSHFVRDTAIRDNKKIKSVYRDYRSLKDWSQGTRYNLVKPSVSNFSTDIEPALMAIKGHLKNLMPDIEM